MATTDSMPNEKPSLNSLIADLNMTLSFSSAIVELVRHHEESVHLTTAMLSADLPDGCCWPGEVDEGVVTAALYGLWDQIRAAQSLVEQIDLAT